MSIHVISAVLNCRDKELTSSRRMVLVCLANYAGEDGRAWPSQQRIADEAGCGVRSVKDHLKWLEANDFIARKTKRLGQGNGSRTSYLISLKRLSETLVRGEDIARANNAHADIARANSVTCKGSIPHVTNRQEPSIDSSNELSDVRQREKSKIQTAYQMFVSAANRQPAWSVPKTLTKSRKASLTARLKELGGLRGWEALIERAEQSPFLTGQTHNQFNLAFDWLLKPANTLKVSEGNYDGKTHTGNTQTSASKTQRFAGGHSAHAGQRPNDTDRFIEALHEAADQHRDREARGRAWGDVDAPNVGVECSGGGSPQEPYTLEGIAYTSEQRAGGADAKSVSRDVSGDQAQQGSDSSGSLLDIDLHETTNRGRAVGF